MEELLRHVHRVHINTCVVRFTLVRVLRQTEPDHFFSSVFASMLSFAESRTKAILVLISRTKAQQHSYLSVRARLFVFFGRQNQIIFVFQYVRPCLALHNYVQEQYSYLSVQQNPSNTHTCQYECFYRRKSTACC